MAWRYFISTGEITAPDATSPLAKGYSGNTVGLNNPQKTTLVGVGPIPVGRYTIGRPHKPVGHLGPLAMPLTPDPSNDMHHRSGFFIHGDNARMNHTASNGCIILGRDFRQAISASGDKTLIVLASPTPV